MKKKTIKKSAPKKTVKRASPRPQQKAQQGVLFQRIVIISACLVLFAAIAMSTHRGALSQAVAGVQIARGLFSQATIQLPNVPNAVSYNIYYGQTGEQNFSNAVRGIPPTVHTYLVSYLKNGVSYQYRIAAVDSSGKEFYFTTTKPLTDLQPM